MESNPHLSQQMLLMIEEKRKKAIELRKRKIEEQKSKTSIQTDPNLVKSVRRDNLVTKNLNSHSNNTFGKTFTEIKTRPVLSSATNNQNVLTSNSQATTKPTFNIQPKEVKKEIKMSIVLENSTSFRLSVDYESNIIKIFKEFHSKTWDPVTKNWFFSIKDFNALFKKLRELNHLNIKFVDSIPDSVIQTLISVQSKKQEFDLTERLDSQFVENLFPYQREGIIFGIQREGKCLIADDMGLGKTVQAIGLAKWFFEDWPLIIVCPSSLRYQWMNAFFRWIPDLKKEDVFVASNTKDIFPKVLVTITSYDLMTRMKNRFTVETNRFYNMIIMDESHYIKSDGSQRTSTALLIAKSCKRIVLLSGTPALSRPIELFPQLNIIDKNLFPSKHGFGLRYCNAKQKTIFKNRKPIPLWDYNGAKNLDELRIILENTIMIRRLKKDVLNELPSKKRDMVCLSTDNFQEKEQKLLNKFKQEITNSNKKDDKKSLVFKWFTESATAKVSAVNEYLIDLLNRDIKLICFCHHKVMLDGVEEMLNKEKINHIRIDGSTPPKIRQEACDTFQNKENFKVALLSLTACATGLNLTAASMVIFAETYWNPGVLAQAEDRVHRIGQQENVRVIYLLARGTIDELIWPLISKKLSVLNKAGLSRDTFDNTNNPLEVSENQQLISEFINCLSQNNFSESDFTSTTNV